MTAEPTSKDKQITIDVPEDRVAEFYAFYGRFLAGPLKRRGPRGRPHHCGPHRGGPHGRPDEATATASPPETQTA